MKHVMIYRLHKMSVETPTVSKLGHRLTRIGNSIIKIRRSHNRLILVFIMETCIPWKMVFISKWDPVVLLWYYRDGNSQIYEADIKAMVNGIERWTTQGNRLSDLKFLRFIAHVANVLHTDFQIRTMSCIARISMSNNISFAAQIQVCQLVVEPGYLASCVCGAYQSVFIINIFNTTFVTNNCIRLLKITIICMWQQNTSCTRLLYTMTP